MKAHVEVVITLEEFVKGAPTSEFAHRGACVTGTPADVIESASRDLYIVWSASEQESRGNGWISAPELISVPEFVAAYRDLMRVAYDNFSSRTPRNSLDNGVWWQTLPSNYSLNSDSEVYFLAKLSAVADALTKADVGRVQLRSLPPCVHDALSQWLSASGFVSQETFYSALDHSTPSKASIESPMWRTRAAIRLFRQWASYRRRLARGGKRKAAYDPCPLVVVDYGGQFVASDASRGAYLSKYWGQVGPLIDRMAPGVVWAHIDVRTRSTPTAITCMRQVRELDGLVPTSSHRVAQCHLTLMGCLRAFTRMMRQERDLRAIWNDSSLWRFGRSNMDARVALREAMREASTGAEALQRCTWDEIMRNVIETFKPQRVIYLTENQPWEHSLLRAAGATPCLAVAHTSVLRTDMRMACIYVEGALPATRITEGSLKLAVNGPVARETLVSLGIPEFCLVAVEASRFMDASMSRDESVTQGDCLLILGTYDRGQTIQILELVQGTLELLPTDVDVVLRNHPGLYPPISQHEFNVRLDVNDSIWKSLQACRWVVCSNNSSTVLNAVLSGCHVILVPDPHALDPGWEDVLHNVARVSNKEDLVRALSGPSTLEKVDEILHLDYTLGRWREVLADFLAPANLSKR